MERVWQGSRFLNSAHSLYDRRVNIPYAATLQKAWNMLWLPLFLVLSMSWLFGPLVQHAHIQNIAVISHYEAFAQPYAWLFRLCDILGAAILATAVYTFKISRNYRWYARLLYAIAILIIIDSVFATSDRSGGGYVLSRNIHGIESVLSNIVLAALTLYDVIRRRANISALFLAFQIACAAIILTSLESHIVLVVMQYLYEVVLITWLAWLVSQFAPSRQLLRTNQVIWRKIFGYWTAFNGILVIILTISGLQSYDSRLNASLEHGYPWIAQHGIIVGVMMLYLARHVRQGQRKAALLLGIIFVSQIVIYSVIRPAAGLLIVALISYVLLWYCSSAFNRNIIPSKLSNRLSDIAIILAGVAITLSLVFTSASRLGEEADLEHAFKHAYGIELVTKARSDIHLKERQLEREAQHLRQVGNTFLLMVLITLLWSIFRPTRFINQQPDLAEKSEIERLLKAHSQSSEDYFKLWPDDKQYYFNTKRSGFIAYKVAGGIAFALADPIASTHAQRQALLDSFLDYCHQQGLSVCFLMVTDMTQNIYRQRLRLAKIGSSGVIDIKQFHEQTVLNKWWRWRINKSTKLGYTYRSHMPPHDQKLLNNLASVSETWLKRAHHQEQSFALGYYDDDYMQKCHIHALYNDHGELVAFTNQLPTYASNNQATVDLIRFMPDADGAMPALIAHALAKLQAEAKFKRFDLGFVPLAKVDSKLASIARRLAESRFSYSGLEQFKGKFKPDWQPNYIAYDGDIINLALIVANLDKVLDPDAQP